MELHGGSTLRRGGGGGRSKAAKTINPLAVYDYALRCAILASLEETRQSQQAADAQKSRHDRHNSVHLGDVLGTISDKFSEDSKPDKLTKEIIRGLLKRIDDIVKGRDHTRHEYHDPKFISSLTLFQRPLQLQKSRPSGTINDLVIIFLKTSEVELKKESPNPAVWGEQLNQHIACFADLLRKTIQEDAPSSASPELIQALQRYSGGPKSTRSNSGNKRSTLVNSPTPGSANGIEALENAPMVQTVQHLFQVNEKDHRKKLRELQPICTESVSVNHVLFFFVPRLVNVCILLGSASGPEKMHKQCTYKSAIPRKKRGFPLSRCIWQLAKARSEAVDWTHEIYDAYEPQTIFG